MVRLRGIQPGDWVVYRKSKISPHPGPRAQDVNPNTKGETYSYTVDKYWVVEQVLDDGRVVLKTRRGKSHTIPATDPNLRRAGLLDWLLHRNRFESVRKGA